MRTTNRLEEDAVQWIGRPRKTSRRAIAARIERLFLALDCAHEELVELRHDLGIAEPLTPQRRKVNPETGR